MFTKQLITAGILISLCFSAYGNGIGNDSVFIRVKVLKNIQHNNLFVNYTENGAYFTRYSYSRGSSPQGPLYRIKANSPIEFSIFTNIKGGIEGLAMPGDTTTVEIDFANPENAVRFSGKTAEVCEFYKAVSKSFPMFYPRAYAQNTSETYINYFIFLEEKYQHRDSFYKAYITTHKLPEWFHSYYKSNLTYEKALAMIENIHSINYNSKNKVYPNPEFLLWFRDIAIDNPNAINSPVYFDFLWQYFLWKNKIIWNRKMGGKVQVEWISKALPSINRELKDPVREWFLKELILNYYIIKEVNEVDSAFSAVKPFVKDKNYLLEISHSREKAIELREQRFAKSAKTGSKAPGFQLLDTLNKQYTVGKFYGSWTFMRFFNSGSFSENAFKTDFLNDTINFRKEKVQFVNIFIGADQDFWKKILAKYPNSGLPLFPRGNWGEILTYQYGLRSFPYYVLVDPQGIIQYSGVSGYNDVLAILKK